MIDRDALMMHWCSFSADKCACRYIENIMDFSKVCSNLFVSTNRNIEQMMGPPKLTKGLENLKI